MPKYPWHHSYTCYTVIMVMDIDIILRYYGLACLHVVLVQAYLIDVSDYLIWSMDICTDPQWIKKINLISNFTGITYSKAT